MHLHIEIFSSILFFMGLLAVYNLREIFIKYNKHSFIQISLGLATLSFSSSFAQIFVNNLASEIAQFVNPLFFQMIYWIGIISGIALLVNGTSVWLPIYKKEKIIEQNNYKKIEIFKKIEQLIRFENRNNIILLQTLELILNQYNFEEVGCYLYSQHEKQFRYIGAATSSTEESIKSDKINFAYSNLEISLEDENYNAIVKSESTSNIPQLVLPIVTHNKLLGLVCIYAQNEIDNASIINLKLILEIISTKMYNDSLAIQHKSEIAKRNWTQKVDQTLDTSLDIIENMRRCKILLQEKLPVDFMSVSFSYNNKNPKYLIAHNNQVLEDLTNVFTESSELENYVVQTNIPVVISNLETETYFQADMIALQNDIKSIAALPIILPNKDKAVFVVGSNEYNAFSNYDIDLLDLVNDRFGIIIINKLNQLKENSDYFRQQHLDKILNRALTSNIARNFYQEITDFLTNELGIAFVRISTFDTDKRFLNSQALTVVNQVTQVTPSDATLMLALMPSHRRVIQTRNRVVTTQTKENQNEFFLEQRQVYGEGIASLVITPFFSEGMMCGVITGGIESESQKLSQSQIKLIDDTIRVLNTFSLYMSRIQEQIRAVDLTIEKENPTESYENEFADFTLEKYLSNLHVTSRMTSNSQIDELVKG